MWVQKVPGGGVSALAFAPDGRTLYTLDRGRWLTAWDTGARSGEKLFQIHRDDMTPGRQISVTSDGRFILFPSDTTRIWELAAKSRYGEVPWEFDRFNPRLDPLNPLLIAPGPQADSLVGWGIRTRAPGPTLIRADPAKRDRFGLSDASADGTVVAALTARKDLVAFDRGSREEVARLSLGGVPGPIHDVRCSADGRVVAVVAGPRVCLWDVGAEAPRELTGRIGNPRRAFAVSPSVPLCASLSPHGTLTFFSLETGRPVRSFDFGLGRNVQCVAFAPDGLTCAAGGSNKRFVVFDVDV